LTFVGLLLFAASGFAATSAFPKRVLILDSFTRDVALFNAVAAPSGAQVRQATFWEDYERLIIVALALCIVEAALIYILLRERRRRRRVQRRLEERVRFEQLVSELTSTFINLPPERVEAQIIDALGQVASFLRFDIAALSVFTGRGAEGRVAYIWRAKGVPEIPSDLTDKDFPWVARELFAERDVSLRTLDGLPPEAHIDRATYERYHVRSTHNVPLVAGGSVIGVLGLCTVWEEREMSRGLLQRQHLLGKIFANALARKTAEESGRESEDNFRSLVETTAAVPWRADVESWVFTYVGPQAVKFLGYPLEQWYEKDFWVSHLHPDDKEFAIRTCLTLSKSAEDFEFEYRMIALSGKVVWVHDIVKCEQRNGKPAQLRGFMLDISERKQAEQAFRDSEARINLAANTTGLGLWMWDATRDESWVTPEGRRLFGWTETEPITFERFLCTVHPDDREPTRQAVLHSMQSGGDYAAEYRVVLSGGETRWITTRGRVEFDGNGNALQLRGVSIEITKRKRAEEALRESETRFRVMADTAPVMIWMSGVDKLCTFFNKGWLDFTGRTVEQELGNGWADGVHRQDFDCCLEAYAEAFDSRREFTMEYRLRRHDGEYCWVLDHGVPRFAPDGTFLGYIGTAIDITELKRAEEKFRLAVEASLSAIVMVNQQGRIVLVNAQTEKLFGYSREELIGHSVELLVPERFRGAHPADRAQFFAAPQVRSMGTDRNLFARRKDGSEFLVEIGLNPIRTDEGVVVLTAIVDITERKRTEEELEKERRFLRQVIDIDPNFIFAKDREGRFTLVNQAVADAYGTTVEDLIGKTDADFNPNHEEVDFFHHMDLEVIDTLKERFIPEERLTDAQGKVRWLQTVKRPIIDKDGSANQVLGASTDITRRKETELELRQQRAELAHVTRIATMGELAASLAHELNQPLTAILSNAQAAQRFLAANPGNMDEVLDILKDIVQDNNRAGEIIRRMRALVKKEEIEFTAVDLASVIRDVVLLVHSDATLHNIHVALELHPDLPTGRGDKVQLQQVMLNLLLNAFDAMKDCPAHERQVIVWAKPDAAGMVKVAVRDRGIGLSREKVDKIFEPFYTTKRDGLGMGLSISRSIVEAHGGRLWAENNADRGATFSFTVAAASGLVAT
jgi:PAS domain S-box-containing protein